MRVTIFNEILAQIGEKKFTVGISFRSQMYQLSDRNITYHNLNAMNTCKLFVFPLSNSSKNDDLCQFCSRDQLDLEKNCTCLVSGL